MSSILDSVDQRTKLVGENRLELLMFRLHSRQVFALNVFKVKEVILLPKLNRYPGAHPHICGAMNYRGSSIPVIDLRAAIQLPGTTNNEGANVIISEYNRSVQGFLIGQILSITNTSWQEIQPPPAAIGKNAFLTALTQVEIDDSKQIVEIIDVEKVLANIVEYDVKISPEVLDEKMTSEFAGRKVLIVDDSSTARGQIKETLEQLGLVILQDFNGQMALDRLRAWADEGKVVTDEIVMMFTDAEMPEMDGYSLTAEVRKDPRMDKLFIALNTSLSGNFNEAMVEKVGCDRFISKFQPDLLVEVVQQRMRQILESQV